MAFKVKKYFFSRIYIISNGVTEILHKPTLSIAYHCKFAKIHEWLASFGVIVSGIVRNASGPFGIILATPSFKYVVAYSLQHSCFHLYFNKNATPYKLCKHCWKKKCMVILSHANNLQKCLHFVLRLCNLNLLQ